MNVGDGNKFAQRKGDWEDTQTGRTGGTIARSISIGRPQRLTKAVHGNTSLASLRTAVGQSFHHSCQDPSILITRFVYSNGGGNFLRMHVVKEWRVSRHG